MLSRKRNTHSCGQDAWPGRESGLAPLSVGSASGDAAQIGFVAAALARVAL
jgi:hypothetical protein